MRIKATTNLMRNRKICFILTFKVFECIINLQLRAALGRRILEPFCFGFCFNDWAGNQSETVQFLVQSCTPEQDSQIVANSQKLLSEYQGYISFASGRTRERNKPIKNWLVGRCDLRRRGWIWRFKFNLNKHSYRLSVVQLLREPIKSSFWCIRYCSTVCHASTGFD